MTVFIIVMITITIISITAMMIAIKICDDCRREKNRLAIEVAKLKSDLDFEKTLQEVKSDIYKKTQTEKQNLENGDNRTKFNNAYNILHNNKS